MRRSTRRRRIDPFDSVSTRLPSTRAALDRLMPAMARTCRSQRVSLGNAVFPAGWTAAAAAVLLPAAGCCSGPAALVESPDAAPGRARQRSSMDASPAPHASPVAHASPGPEARSRPAALLVAARQESPPHSRCGTYDASAFPPGAIRRAPLRPHAATVGWAPPRAAVAGSLGRERVSAGDGDGAPRFPIVLDRGSFRRLDRGFSDRALGIVRSGLHVLGLAAVARGLWPVRAFGLARAPRAAGLIFRQRREEFLNPVAIALLDAGSVLTAPAARIDERGLVVFEFRPLLLRELSAGPVIDIGELLIEFARAGNPGRSPFRRRNARCGNRSSVRRPGHRKRRRSRERPARRRRYAPTVRRGIGSASSFFGFAACGAGLS